MKKRIIFIIMISILLFTANAMAAIHTISIANLPSPSKIEAFNIWFDVSSDFQLNGPVLDGGAVPTAVDFGWSTDVEDVAVPLFKFAKSNMDGWALGIENNLLNGQIASFDYSGSIFGVSFFQFGDFLGQPVNINLIDYDQDQTVFSAVPIPPAIALLGGGLMGLFFFRRKSRN